MLPQDFTFANPWVLSLLLLIPLLALWKWNKYRQQYPEMRYSSPDGFEDMQTLKSRLRPLLWWLKILAFALIIIALARPQNRFKEQKITADGIDIVMVMDVSGSMLARDFEPDRLEASKQIAAEFIQNRAYDRIGLVVFAGESFTQCPVTTDQKVLLELLSGIKSGLIADGTAIGMGLATAVNRLRESQSKSKVVILLTDGVNNQGFIDPLTAAETAKSFGVKVYTIGVGTKGKAPYPVRGLFGNMQLQYMDVNIDEDLLQQIADMTGGKYFRATDNAGLRRVYDEIDRLEKTKIDVTTVSRFTERFHPFVIAAVLLLLLHMLLRATVFRSVT